MSERRLLRSHETDADERELLSAGETEQPSDEARRRTLLALGIPPGTSGPGGGGAGAPQRGSRGSGKVAGPRKWPLVALGAAILAGGIWAAIPRQVETARAPPGFAASSTEPLTLPQEPLAPTAIVPEPAEPAAGLTAPAPTTTTRAPLPSASSDENADLAAEVVALDRARQALDRGDATAALRALDDYQRRFPLGTMRPEATVVRIEALVRKGDAAGARRVADGFLATHPQSPHAQRIRFLVGEWEP